MPGLTLELDPKGTVLWTSKGVSHAMILDRAKHGQPFRLIGFKDNDVQTILERARQGKSTRARIDQGDHGYDCHFEPRLESDGSCHHILMVCTPLRQDDASPEGSRVGFDHSVDRVDPARTPQILQSTFDSLLTQIVMVDAQGIILASNRSWKILTRFGPGVHVAERLRDHVTDFGDGMRGRSYFDVLAEMGAMSGPELHNAQQAIEQVVADRSAAGRFEIGFSAAGRPQYYQASAVNLGSKQRQGAVISHANITEVRRAQDALLREHRVFDALMESNATAVAILNPEGRFVLCNRRAEELLETSGGDLCRLRHDDAGWNITDVDGNPMPSDELPFAQAVARDDLVDDHRYAINWPDGRRKFLSVNAAPLHDNHGQLTGVVMSLSDITDAREREQDLKHYLEAESLTREVSTTFLQASWTEFDAAFEKTLRNVASFCGAAGAVVFKRSNRWGDEIWRSDAAAASPEATSHWVAAVFDYCARNKGQIECAIASPAELPDDADDPRKRLAKAGVKAFYVLGIQSTPLIDAANGTKFAGMIAVYSHEQREFSRIERWLLTTLRDIYAHTLSRRDAEDALREERVVIDTIINSPGALVVVLNPQGEVIRFNPSCEELSGYSEAHLKGMQLWQLPMIPAQDRDDYHSAVDRALSSREPVFLEGQWITLSGQRRLINWSLASTQPGTELVDYVIATGVDVTVGRVSEAALRHRLEAENLISRLAYRLLSGRADRTMIIGSLGQIADFMGADRAALVELSDTGETTGAVQEWYKSGLQPLFAELARNPFQHSQWYLERLRRHEPVYVQNVEQLPPEAEPERNYGAEHGIQSTLVAPIVADDRLVGALGLCAVAARRSWSRSDINTVQTLADLLAHAEQRWKAEAALRRSEQRYRGLIESQQDPLIRLTRQGDVTFVNDAMAKLLGQGVSELTSSTLPDLLPLVHLEDIPAFVPLMREVMRPPHSASLQCRIRAGNDWRWLMWSVYGIQDKFGRTVELQAVGRDITESRRSAEMQRERQKELAQVARLITVGEIATGLAHELNQPLGAMVNFTYGAIRRIERGSAAPDEIVDVLREVVEQGERAGRIIHNLRRFIGHRELQQSLADLNELVKSAMELATIDAEKHGVSVRTSFNELPLVQIDPVLIEQVLVNLITNAMDELKRHDGKRELHLRTLRLDSDQLCVQVQDTGPGLPSGDPGQVFKAFFSTKGHGLGMGLAISRTIVQGHGGQLVAENAEGGGAQFSLILPPEGAPHGPLLEQVTFDESLHALQPFQHGLDTT